MDEAKLQLIFERVIEAAFTEFKGSCTLYEFAEFCKALESIKKEMTETKPESCPSCDVSADGHGPTFDDSLLERS